MPNFILNCQDLYGGGDYGDADLPDEIECQLIQKTLLINGAVRIDFNLEKGGELLTLSLPINGAMRINFNLGGGGAFDIILFLSTERRELISI